MSNTMRMAAVVVGFMSASAYAIPDEPVMCPMVYKPATCSYEEYSVSDSNSCFARVALLRKLKMHGIDPDPSKIRCVSGETMLRAALTDCGIVPTFTSCSVELDGQLFQSSAQGCDSPLPGLREQLRVAGVEDSRGLTAVCSKSQQAEETNFTLAL